MLAAHRCTESTHQLQRLQLTEHRGQTVHNITAAAPSRISYLCKQRKTPVFNTKAVMVRAGPRRGAGWSRTSRRSCTGEHGDTCTATRAGDPAVQEKLSPGYSAQHQCSTFLHISQILPGFRSRPVLGRLRLLVKENIILEFFKTDYEQSKIRFNTCTSTYRS